MKLLTSSIKACNFFYSICHIVDQAFMVLSVAQAYFKTAFNSRSIVDGIISNSHGGLHRYRNVLNVEFKTPDYY